MTKQEILLAQREFLFPAVFHYYKDPLVVSRAKDQYVWDADGKQYLDFLRRHRNGECRPLQRNR